MSAKTIACRILDTMKISYTVHEYEWAEGELDAVTAAHKVGLPAGQIFKTLVLHGDKTGIVMACLPGDKELNLKLFATVSGNKKAEMIPMKDLQKVTGYIRGGVSPLGVKKHYPLYLDESIVTYDIIGVSAGKRGVQIFLKGTDLQRATSGTLAAICH